MNMKKSAIALAVTGAIAAPFSAAQAEPEVYGEMGLQLQNTSVSDDGAPSTGYFFNSNGDETGFTMNDGWESRFGIRGSEDLGGGLSAEYRWEFGTNFDGINNQGSDIDTRLGYLGLSGDFGSVRLGTIWSAVYEYSGWNIWRTPSNGSFTYNYLTGSTGLDDVAGGLRIDNSIQYSYGGGGYGSDPFSFSVEAGFEDDNRATGTATDDDGAPVNDEETLDHVTVGAQGTFGPVKVNGFYYSESNSDTAGGATTADPSAIGLGGEFSAGPAWVGLSYITVDQDDGDGSDPSGGQITGGFDFGGGTSLTASLGSASADDGSGGTADIDSQIYVHLSHEMSSRTSVYTDVESVSLSDDTGADVFTVGMQHSF